MVAESWTSIQLRFSDRVWCFLRAGAKNGCPPVLWIPYDSLRKSVAELSRHLHLEYGNSASPVFICTA